MSLSSDSAVLTMPVQPANNSYNNGCNGWGGDWMGWIVLFLIFGMFGWGVISVFRLNGWFEMGLRWFFFCERFRNETSIAF